MQLLRSHALGSFNALLQTVSHDPAVLLWLDADASRKARPNENCPRQLMEQFRLGTGHYSDKDVSEAINYRTLDRRLE